MVQINCEYFDVLDVDDIEFEEQSACSVRQWLKESAMKELKESVDEIQIPYLDYFVRAGVVAADDVDYHAFSVSVSTIDFVCGGAEDESRFFLALKCRTLASSFEDFGVIKTSTARNSRDAHLRGLDMSPVPPHSMWILSRIVARLSRVGNSEKCASEMKAGQVAVIAEPAQEDRLSWKFLSRAAYTY